MAQARLLLRPVAEGLFLGNASRLRSRPAAGKIASGAAASTLSADAIENAFTDANPGLSKRGISISCDGKRLEEVRICLNRDMTFRDCPELDRKGCRANAAEIIPIR